MASRTGPRPRSGPLAKGGRCAGFHSNEPDHDFIISRASALVSVAYVESIKTQKFLGNGVIRTLAEGTDPIAGHEFTIKSITAKILKGGDPADAEGRNSFDDVNCTSKNMYLL